MIPGMPAHLVDEEEAIAAKQTLDIGLGGRDENVDALVLEQDVEPLRVEGASLSASSRGSFMPGYLQSSSGK
jgi:hypothetical protein